MKLDFCEVFDDYTSRCRKIPKEKYLSNGKYIVIDQGQNNIAGYTNIDDGLFEDVPAIVFGDHTRIIKYVDEPFFLGADGVKLLKSKIKDANYKYLYYALRNARIPDTGYNRHFKWLKEIDLEYKDVESQKNIVKALDTATNIIELYKVELSKLDNLVRARFVEMFGDLDENPHGWNKSLLSNVILNANNGMSRRGNDKYGNIVMRLIELQEGFIDYSRPNRIMLKDYEKKRYLLKEKDVLFARVNGNPNNVGRCAVFYDIDEDVYHNDHIIRVHFDEKILDAIFASTVLNSDYGKRQLMGKIKTSAGQYTVSQDGIGSILIALPPIEIQQEFASFVEQVNKSKLLAISQPQIHIYKTLTLL